jgi:hypothetical protein
MKTGRESGDLFLALLAFAVIGAGSRRACAAIMRKPHRNSSPKANDPTFATLFCQ